MITKDDFREGIDKLLTVYPNWSFDCEDAEGMAIMYSFFKDMNINSFKKMVDEHILKERYNPTVASLKDCIQKSNGVRVDYDKIERIKKLREENE